MGKQPRNRTAIANLNSHDFDVRLYGSNQILDALERAGYRAWTGAACALVVHAELVASQANHMQIAAIAFQIGAYLGIQ